MKTSDLALWAYEAGFPCAAITFGNEWITLRIKFPARQVVEVRYPAELAPYKGKYGQHKHFSEHLVEAENYWYVMANTAGDQRDIAKVMCARSAKILAKVKEYEGLYLMALVSKWSDKEVRAAMNQMEQMEQMDK